MINLKSQKGSITLFVLVSCLFFVATVVCIQMNVSSKQIAVEREYMQIKSNYEKDLTNMNEIYTRLSEFDVQFEDISVDQANGNISATISLSSPIDVKELKYGWLYNVDAVESSSLNSSDIQVWTYAENTDSPITAILNNAQNSGYYYLCCMLNNKEYWKEVVVN